MANRIIIKAKGIRKVLAKYDYCQSIAEYIWNGFDAKATSVDVIYDSNEIGTISEIRIIDNGYGIPQEELKQKFEPFFESEKAIEIGSSKNHSLTHGKNGVGRLTFFTFANKATWQTVYKNESGYFEYQNSIEKNALEKYSGIDSPLVKSSLEETGTTVLFSGIQMITSNRMENEVIKFLKKEFGWFLELNKHKGFAIRINGVPLDYSNIIGETEKSKITYSKTGVNFDMYYIRWNDKINKEYSRYYYMDSSMEERWKEHTTLNNKGDHFFHSIFIKSSYFDNFTFQAEEGGGQSALIGGTRADEVFKYLQKELTAYLRRKRKPFLKEYADKLISEYEQEGVIPEFKDAWEQIRKDELENIIRGLYEVQPRIFTSFNVEQKKTFVGLLNLLLDSDERERLLEIIKGVVELDSEERAELAGLLKSTNLSKITKTIKLIEDRYRVIAQLKELVFNKNLGANERDHIQKIVESNYWIFGEQYHLVTSAEQKFEEALRRFIHILTGEDADVAISHIDKNREMDIFMCKQDKDIDKIKSIVVELKHPEINLGEKHLTQIKKYMGVILKQDEFNAGNMFWEFYLVGNGFDGTNYIEGEIENAKSHGENFLAFKTERYKIYIKKWSEVFNDFDCKHEFINEKLRLEKDFLVKEYKNADEVIQALESNSATLPQYAEV